MLKDNFIFSTDFLSKVREANKLYKDAFMELVPEPARSHLSVIDKECHALFSELIVSAVSPAKAGDDIAPTKKSNIKKVNIG